MAHALASGAETQRSSEAQDALTELLALLDVEDLVAVALLELGTGEDL